MKKIYSHENLTILHSAKGLLELNDIQCFVKNEHHASGGHVGWAAVPIELWVHNDADAATAATILDRELAQASTKPSWTCNQCQEENDGAFEICWKCQKEPELANG